MKKWTALILICVLLLSSCAAPAPEGPMVAATTAPLAQFLEALCQGTDIQVRLIVSEPVSCLHDYSLTVGQMRVIGEADCVFLSGADLEHFMEGALTGAASIDCSTGIDLLELEDEPDPHIWLAPENGKKMAENAAVGLTALYPQWADTIGDNLAALTPRFDELQNYGERALENLPVRELITFHDGFSYFAGAFGLTILAAMEEESGSEASANALARISELVTTHGLPAVFTEENGSTAAAGAISRETGCVIYTLSTGLGGGDYFEIMGQNIDIIKEAME